MKRFASRERQIPVSWKRRRRALAGCTGFGVGLALCVAGAGQAGIGHAPETMQSWATEVDDFVRGPIDILDPEGEKASHGLPETALGPATTNSADVFSLGDGGFMTLFFEEGIGDGNGDDFAVYENGFFSVDGLFAEFAFVDVSSNGIDFARFDAISYQAIPVPGFGTVDPDDYENFAGDQPIGLGTGFDLAELAAHPLVMSGALDLTDVSYVRLVDVIGDGSTFDADAQPVYDPYPTGFATGGFDVEAVGVLHAAPEPGASLMLGIGGGLLTLLERRRRRRVGSSARHRALA